MFIPDDHRQTNARLALAVDHAYCWLVTPTRSVSEGSGRRPGAGPSGRRLACPAEWPKPSLARGRGRNTVGRGERPSLTLRVSVGDVPGCCRNPVSRWRVRRPLLLATAAASPACRSSLSFPTSPQTAGHSHPAISRRRSRCRQKSGCPSDAQTDPAHRQIKPGPPCPFGEIVVIKEPQPESLIKPADLLINGPLHEQAETRQLVGREPLPAILVAHFPGKGAHRLAGRDRARSRPIEAVWHSWTLARPGRWGEHQPMPRFPRAPPASASSPVFALTNPINCSSHPSVTITSLFSSTRYSPRAALSP